MRKHCASGLRALQASGNGALRHKQHQSRNPTSQYTKCLSTQPKLHMSRSEKAIPLRAPLTLKPRALGLPAEKARAHAMCWHRRTKICWRTLAGHRVALIMLRSVPPTEPWGQKRTSPNPAATRSAWSPANKWCLRVVPSPCHEAAEPLSPILCGVLVQLSTDRVLPPPIWKYLWRNCC